MHQIATHGRVNQTEINGLRKILICNDSNLISKHIVDMYFNSLVNIFWESCVKNTIVIWIWEHGEIIIPWAIWRG